MTITHLVLRYLHITAGTVGLLSGAAAMTFRKGSRPHRWSGNAFFVSVFTLGASGAIIAAFLKPNPGSLMGGMMAMYMVATAWITVIRVPGRTGRFEIVAALGGAAVAAIAITFAIQATMSTNGRLHGYPTLMYMIFAAVALLAVTADIRMIVRGGFTGTARTTRHLWRMCVAFFMATGSFFFGQPRFVPEFVKQNGLVPILGLLPLMLLLYWLFRVRLSRRGWRLDYPPSAA